MNKRLILVGVLLFSAPAISAAADRPTFESLRAEASHPGCAPKDYADFVLVTCENELTLWYFTKTNHPAHPGVIKRVVVQDAAKNINVQMQGWSFGADSTQPAFKSWLAQIENLNRQMREAIERQHQSAGRSGN